MSARAWIENHLARWREMLLHPPHPPHYQPESYWEGRAGELIAIYDDPTSWAARDWATAGAEERIVPALLERFDIRSVFVAGAGSGRQYAFLKPLVLEIRGIDISPTLAAECRSRYPDIETTTDTLLGVEARQPPADAAITSAVLQHVPPTDLPRAVASLKAMTRNLVVLREMTWRKDPSDYQWAHDYRGAFADWTLVLDEQTDATEHAVVQLMAWQRP